MSCRKIKTKPPGDNHGPTWDNARNDLSGTASNIWKRLQGQYDSSTDEDEEVEGGGPHIPELDRRSTRFG